VVARNPVAFPTAAGIGTDRRPGSALAQVPRPAEAGGVSPAGGGIRAPWIVAGLAISLSFVLVNTFHRLKATASEANYAATRRLDAPRPAPSPFNHGNARYLTTFAGWAVFFNA
jgi:hypothetical protein